MRNERAMRNGMRRAVLGALMGAALVASGDVMAQATPRPPERLTYQGFIAGSDGVALGNSAPKNYDVIFRIYDTEASNTPLWGEQQTVTVDKGYFSVLLGEGAAVTGVPNSGITMSSLFSGATASDRYVGFTVKGIGTGGADVEILPRVRLMSAPYAFLANRALSATKLVQDNATGADLLSASGSQLSLGGNLLVQSGKYLQLGMGEANKEVSAGMISYKFHTPDSLEIVGAGTTSANRKITLIAEGGTTLTGPLSVPSLSISGDTAFNNINMAGNMTVVGTGGILLGGGRTKAYPWNGYINYGKWDHNNKDALFFQGGGNQVAERQIVMWAEGGLTLLGQFNVWGTSSINLGYAIDKPDAAAGTISYQKWSAGLDIVGAGTSQATRKVTFHSQGGVGINIVPAYPLDVNGSATYASFPVTLRLSNAGVSSGWLTYSDQRIKDVVGESSASQDMARLRKIRVTDYRLKDRNPADQRIVKGVVAQQLREALPDAVMEGANVVPVTAVDAISVARGPGVAPIVAKFAGPHGIQAGDRVRLDVDGSSQYASVTEVPDDRTIAFQGGTEAPKRVRLVGREVKDFLNVDYQQVYMTAVSALQEVDRRVQELEKREARVAELERKAAKVETMERDLAELKKLVSALSSEGSKAKQSASVETTGAGASVAIAR